ncbi:hypothetical protein PGQ11_010710 [Apiospora arundinis]|uniref:C2H2-type domain-containing protein n=1 Tax=Apiospora arundinis TaxID=335852 RepID=A0ABR2IAY2_9PEZI
MAPLHITGNGHGSTNNGAVDANHACTTCHKVFSSRRNLFHLSATLKDNEQAKADRAGQKAIQYYPIEQTNTSTEIMDDNPTSSEERDDGSSDSDVGSDKPTDGGALSSTSLQYEQRIAHLEEQIAEERDGHFMEIEDLHKMYKSKRQNNKMVIKELRALIAKPE